MKNVTGMSVEKMMSRMFKKVDSVVWDLMSGRLGIRTKDGEIATIEGTGDDTTVVINPFEDFGIVLPAFAQNTPLESVKEGDLIYTGGDSPGWIVSIKKNTEGKTSFRVIRPGGTISSWNPPKVQMFGLDSGVLVVRSLMTMLPGGADGLAGLQGSLLPMLALGGDSFDIEKILPLMLMTQAGGAGAANPMGGIMQMLMLQKMLGSDSGFSGFFGGGDSTRRSPFNPSGRN